jgi:hypothetical protein
MVEKIVEIERMKIFIEFVRKLQIACWYFDQIRLNFAGGHVCWKKTKRRNRKAQKKLKAKTSREASRLVDFSFLVEIWQGFVSKCVKFCGSLEFWGVVQYWSTFEIVWNFKDLILEQQVVLIWFFGEYGLLIDSHQVPYLGIATYLES